MSARSNIIPFVLACAVLQTQAIAEEETPDADFLEYLGSWSESDEDWMVISSMDEVSAAAHDEERIDPAPTEGKGEASTENEDES